MKLAFSNIKSSVVISTALVLPLIIMELVNRRNYHEGFPVSLFVILWLLPMAFILILKPTMRKVQASHWTTPNLIRLLLGIVCLLLIAWFWTGILLDQMPCFLGVPICD
jgi:hypothetical protein